MSALIQTAKLVSQVRELELIARKNVSGFFAGNYASTILGGGLEFHEARKYVPGESVRFIDWNMTARRREVYVKLYREEREREIFIAVDVSPSMFFGTQQRTKIETALELAATLGLGAIESGDKLGLVAYADKALTVMHPRKGRSHYYAVLKELIALKNAPPQNVAQTDLESAISQIQNLKGRKFMVFFVSDFIEHDIPEDLRLIQSRHDVTLVHVYDPFEYAPDKGLRLPFVSPEGGGRTMGARPGSCGTFAEIENFLKGSSLKYGIDTVSVSTKDAPDRRLLAYFREKRQRRERRC